MYLIFKRRIALQGVFVENPLGMGHFSNQLPTHQLLSQDPKELINLYLSPQRPPTEWFKPNPIIREMRRQVAENLKKSEEFAALLFKRVHIISKCPNSQNKSNQMNDVLALINGLPPTLFAIFYVTRTYVSLALYNENGKKQFRSINRNTGICVSPILGPNMSSWFYGARDQMPKDLVKDITTSISHRYNVSEIFRNLSRQLSLLIKQGHLIPDLPKDAYWAPECGRRAFKGLERGIIGVDAPIWKYPLQLFDCDQIAFAQRIRSGQFDLKKDPRVGEIVANYIERFTTPIAQREIAISILDGRFPITTRSTLGKNILMFNDPEANSYVARGILDGWFGTDQDMLAKWVPRIEGTEIWTVFMPAIKDGRLNSREYGEFIIKLADTRPLMSGIDILRCANMLSKSTLGTLLYHLRSDDKAEDFARNFSQFTQLTRSFDGKNGGLTSVEALTVVAGYLSERVFDQFVIQKLIEPHIGVFQQVQGFPFETTPRYVKNAFVKWEAAEAIRQRDLAERSRIAAIEQQKLAVEAEKKRIQEEKWRAEEALRPKPTRAQELEREREIERERERKEAEIRSRLSFAETAAIFQREEDPYSNQWYLPGGREKALEAIGYYNYNKF